MFRTEGWVHLDRGQAAGPGSVSYKIPEKTQLMSRLRAVQGEGRDSHPPLRSAIFREGQLFRGSGGTLGEP